MSYTMINFSGDKVALVMRGKVSSTAPSAIFEQHADCAQSNGNPVGYFGQEGRGLVFSFRAALIGVDGAVFNLTDYEMHRPYFVRLNEAKARGTISTALVVSVANGEARLFDDYWRQLKNDPGTFQLLGKNCATRASGAFRHSGILSGGIPGMGTPDGLFDQLLTERRDRSVCYSGYVGFSKVGNGCALQVEPVAQPYRVAETNLIDAMA